MRRAWDNLDAESAEAYAEWLELHRSHEELLARAAEIARLAGPAMPGRMRRDFGEFLRERSERELARMIALNDDPRDDAEFAAARRDASPRAEEGRP